MTLQTVTRVEAHCDAPRACEAVLPIPRGGFLLDAITAAGWSMVPTDDDKLMHYCPDHRPAPRGCTCAVGHEDPDDLVPDCTVHGRARHDRAH